MPVNCLSPEGDYVADLAQFHAILSVVLQEMSKRSQSSKYMM